MGGRRGTGVKTEQVIQIVTLFGNLTRGRSAQLYTQNGQETLLKQSNLETAKSSQSLNIKDKLLLTSIATLSIFFLSANTPDKTKQKCF